MSAGELLVEYGRLPRLLGCHDNPNQRYYGWVSVGTVLLTWMGLEQVPHSAALARLQQPEMWQLVVRNVFV